MRWGCSVLGLETGKETAAGGLGPALGLGAALGLGPALGMSALPSQLRWLRVGKKFFPLFLNPTEQTYYFYVPKVTFLYSFIHIK